MFREPKYITYNGETLLMSKWAKKLGMHPATLLYRLQHLPVEEALTRPISKIHRQNALSREPHTLPKVAKPEAGVEGLTKCGQKPYKTVWRELYDSIKDDEMYAKAVLATLTSGGTAQRAVKEGEIYIHKYEGGVERVKGYDIKQWLLKKGYEVKSMPVAKKKQEAAVAPAKISAKIVPIVVYKSSFNWTVAVLVSAIVGSILGWTLNYFRVL